MKKFSNLMCLAGLATMMACGASVNAGIPSTPDGTVVYVSQQLADGHPEILWEALPTSYQADITGLTHDFAAKMDAEVWDKTFAVTSKAVKLLQDKKELFFQTSLFQMAGEKKDEIAGNWDTATTTFGTLLTSDISRLESLKTMDWKNFLSTTGVELMKIAKEASATTEDNSYEKEFLAKVRGMKVKVKESAGDSATIVIMNPDEEPEEVKFTRVEGRWVPAEMAQDWEQKITEARAKLDTLTPETMAQQKMQFMMFLGMGEGMIDQLGQAQTPEQLEQMLGGIFGQFMKPSQGSTAVPVDSSETSGS